MQLFIVGAGAMGRWFADTVVRGLPDDVDLAFADVDAAVCDAAVAERDARRVPVDGAERFDVVCLAVPISSVEKSVVAQADRARHAMVDVSGVMGTTLSAMRTHLPDRERVSYHPLFAPANAPGNVAVVADEPGQWTDRLCAALSAAGNDLFTTTADEHDRAMETVQSSVHAAVLAYALAARDVPPEFHTPVSAALADVVETVTGGTPRVYREIQETFDGAERVAEAAARVAGADEEEFDALYREASAYARRVSDATADDERDERGNHDGGGLSEHDDSEDGE